MKQKEAGLSVITDGEFRISGENHPFVEHFKFVKLFEDENVTARQTIPAPAQLLAELYREDNGKNTNSIYPDQEELIQDIAAAYRTVIQDLYTAGCRNLQFDDERSGDFEPLRFVSENKKVVLGLVTTKSPVLEEKEQIKKRIQEATKYIPLNRLCLSPQCGFASCEIGNNLTEKEEFAKIRLIKEIAQEVWNEEN